MKVRVYNTNKYPFEQKFRDDVIKIPPGGFVEMERDEAVAFKSTWYPVRLDYNGNVDESSYKRISIKPIPGAGEVEIETPKFVNQATGEAFETHAQLMASINADPELVSRQRAANEDLEVAKNVKAAKSKANA
jgi:hypothetical protein